mgnify:FL=1
MFVVRPELLQNDMPKTYAKLEEIYGEQLGSNDGALPASSRSGFVGRAGQPTVEQGKLGDSRSSSQAAGRSRARFGAGAEKILEGLKREPAVSPKHKVALKSAVELVEKFKAGGEFSQSEINKALYAVVMAKDRSPADRTAVDTAIETYVGEEAAVFSDEDASLERDSYDDERDLSEYDMRFHWRNAR